MSLFAEISDWIRFAFRTPDRLKEIVFYSEGGNYWAYFEGLADALLSEGQSFCYVTSDPRDPILKRSDPRIHTFRLTRLLPFFMTFVKCRVFVMTLTELDLHHLKRSIQPVHYVYVFHSLNSIHMAYRHRAFDHYDSILCCGPYQIEEIRRDEELRGLKKKTLVDGGYYRVERIHEAARKRGILDPSKVSGRCVLIAPSWAAHNVLEDHAITLVETLLGAGYDVIMRPHPETLKRRPELVNAFDAHFETQDRVVLERSVISDESLLRADVLITDWSGIAQEYAFGTERPVLYLDVPRKVHNDDYESLGLEPFEARIRSEIGVVLPTSEIAEIDRAIDRLIQDRETFRDRIVALRTQSLFCFGHSSEAGARHLAELIGRAPLPTKEST